MKNKADTVVWVAVKVERGYVSEAKIYKTLGAANRTKLKWRSSINQDYDEVGVVMSRLN